MTDCFYEELDPDGGVAKCIRGDHKGIHLVKRKSGGTFMENLGLHKMWLADYDTLDNRLPNFIQPDTIE